LHKAAYFFLYDADEAADLCQDAFLKAYNNIGRFDEHRSFYPWLYTILKNLCINYKKRASRYKSSELFEETVPSSYANPETELLEKDASERLVTAISRLPDMYREILVLKVYNNLSYEDIAKTLDIPKGTVMSRLYNARVKLRNILKEMEG
jgi:RNA polymerase sigma-70 factor (ECF subfamily)